MGDDDESARVGAQVVAQPQDRVVVEVVGRLVQEQRVRLLEEDAGELDAAALTSGEGADGLVEDAVRQPECRGDSCGLAGGRVAAGHGELVVEAGVAVQGPGHGVALGGLGDLLLGLVDALEEGVDSPGREDAIAGDLGEVADLRVLGQVADRAVARDRALVLDGLEAVGLVGVGDGLAGALGHGLRGEQLGHGGLAGSVPADEPDPHTLVHPVVRARDELAGADAHGEVLDVDHGGHATGRRGASRRPQRVEAAGDRSHRAGPDGRRAAQSHQSHHPVAPPVQAAPTWRISSGIASASRP